MILRIDKLDDPMYEEVRYYSDGKQEYIKRKNMKIYLFMCLNDVIGETYYTDEDEVKRLVEEANINFGGDFGYMTLTKNQ